MYMENPMRKILQRLRKLCLSMNPILCTQLGMLTHPQVAISISVHPKGSALEEDISKIIFPAGIK